MRRTPRDVDSVDPRADRERFRALVAEVADPVRRYLWRRTDEATADDVLAETLVVLWRRRADEPRERIPWAIGIARKQLAVALGISANAAAVRLHRARTRFEEAFRKDAAAAGQVEATEGGTR